MADILDQELESSLHMAFMDARMNRHELITVEHLLFAMIDNPTASDVLTSCGANLDKLRVELGQYIEEKTPIYDDGVEEIDVQPTLGFQRCIQRAMLHVKSSGKKKVTGANILVAIFGEKDSYSVTLLNKQAITRLDVIEYLSHGFSNKSDRSDQESNLERIKDFIDTVSVGRSKLKLFISYSHKDKQSLDRLLVHLKPIERDSDIECWSDKKIVAGTKWKEQINEKIQESIAAILLISADFLASDFVVTNELPPLLAKAESQGIRIIPVILKPCGFHRHPQLYAFQAVNDPKEPLLGFDHIKQEEIYDQIAEEVFRELNLRNKYNH